MTEQATNQIMRSLTTLGEKLDDHIERSDVVHADTTKVLAEIKPILENIQAVKKVGGWLGWVLNSKVGWMILVALAGYIGVKN
jgi:hypothetical protein